MRVTSRMMTNNLLKNLSDNMDRLDKFNRQLSTGKKFNMPSQNPTGVARSMRLESTIGDNKQYLDNIDQAKTWTSATENALKNATEILQRSRELAIYGASGSLSNTDREAIAQEVNELKKSFVEIANSTYNDKYIFSGDKTLIKPYKKTVKLATPATGIVGAKLPNDSEFPEGDYTVEFNATGTEASLKNAQGDTIDTVTGLTNNTAGTITFTDKNGNTLEIDKDNSDMSSKVENLTVDFEYFGGTGEINREITQGVEMTINEEGSFLKGILDEMQNLVSDLRLGNTDKVSNDRIANLDKELDEVLKLRAKLGAKQNRLNLTKDRLEEDKIKFKKLLSENEDVDIAKTIMELKMSENVQRAALASGARIIQPSLVQFLK